MDLVIVVIFYRILFRIQKRKGFPATTNQSSNPAHNPLKRIRIRIKLKIQVVWRLKMKLGLTMEGWTIEVELWMSVDQWSQICIIVMRIRIRKASKKTVGSGSASQCFGFATRVFRNGRDLRRATKRRQNKKLHK